jgi:hypothetical protein
MCHSNIDLNGGQIDLTFKISLRKFEEAADIFNSVTNSFVLLYVSYIFEQLHFTQSFLDKIKQNIIRHIHLSNNRFDRRFNHRLLYLADDFIHLLPRP